MTSMLPEGDYPFSKPFLLIYLHHCWIFSSQVTTHQSEERSYSRTLMACLLHNAPLTSSHFPLLVYWEYHETPLLSVHKVQFENAFHDYKLGSVLLLILPFSSKDQPNKDRTLICLLLPMMPLVCEASPHKRRLKCDTNISPRRLMAHLLHQMVHHRTTLRGNRQRSATIARITTHTHTTILIIKRGSSESCSMRN